MTIDLDHRTIDQALQRRLIEAVAASIISHTEELTRLDQAIGDGDHGLNMRRGFEAVLADIDSLAARSFPESLRAIGTCLVLKVGGASGPLYGTLFLALGKELPEAPQLADVARALGAAIAAVMARGKSQPGQKTMLDVLAPTHAELSEGGGDLTARLKARAQAAAAATVPMRALRGRASFLGDRSIGHMDPGARSASLMIETICDVLGG
jgi:dihydroxyacetone kinase-like protein